MNASKMGGASSLGSRMSSIQINGDNVKAIFDKRVQKMQLAFDKKVRDIKPFVLDYAQHWIKDQTRTVTEYFTK